MEKMSRFEFYVPKLVDAGAWKDYRNQFSGGFGWRNNVAGSAYRYISIHHTVTNPQNNLYNEVSLIHRYHTQNNGWGGIGYNFIIGTEITNGYAKVAYVGDLGSIRAHTPNYKGALGIPAKHGNVHLIGIAFIGRFDAGRGIPSQAQLRSAHELVKELIFAENHRLPNLKDDWNHTLRTHKEFDSTACAGDFHLYKSKIINAGSAPKPQPVPKPDENVQQVKVQAGWGLSHVAKAAGLPMNENSYNHIYNLNKGHRGSWDWRSLNARMGAGDILIVNKSESEKEDDQKIMEEINKLKKQLEAEQNKIKALEKENEILENTVEERDESIKTSKQEIAKNQALLKEQGDMIVQAKQLINIYRNYIQTFRNSLFFRLHTMLSSEARKNDENFDTLLQKLGYKK